MASRLPAEILRFFRQPARTPDPAADLGEALDALDIMSEVLAQSIESSGIATGPQRGALAMAQRLRRKHNRPPAGRAPALRGLP